VGKVNGGVALRVQTVQQAAAALSQPVATKINRTEYLKQAHAQHSAGLLLLPSVCS
jgi:hypothetical protein